METQNNSKGRLIWAETKDLFAGAAFPFMLMVILCATIISYASYGVDVGLSVAALVLGDLFLVIAYVIFGKQNGVSAVRRTIQQSKKRDIGAADFNALNGVGEYAVWKGIAIALISCLPFIIVQIVGSAAPNKVCDFLLEYMFGWAYFPFSFFNASTWLNLIWVIPLVCIHGGAYIYGGYKERERQKKVAKAEEMQGEKNKK